MTGAFTVKSKYGIPDWQDMIIAVGIKPTSPFIPVSGRLVVLKITFNHGIHARHVGTYTHTLPSAGQECSSENSRTENKTRLHISQAKRQTS